MKTIQNLMGPVVSIGIIVSIFFSYAFTGNSSTSKNTFKESTNAISTAIFQKDGICQTCPEPFILRKRDEIDAAKQAYINSQKRKNDENTI